jgi:Ca2+-binding RTX toxin-like protein
MGGDDTMTGGGGNDLLIGGGGFNSMDGGVGNDTLVSDALVGGFPEDTLLGGDGDDLLVLDTLVSGVVSRTLDGGNGFDSLAIRAEVQNAWIGLWGSSVVSLEQLLLEGGAGTRTVSMVSSQIGAGVSSLLTVDARNSTAFFEILEIDVEGGVLDISGWTALTTAGGARVRTRILSDNQFSQIYGGALDDDIDVDPYFDFPDYLSETSVIFAGSGNDTVRGGLLGSDVIYGGDGDDLILSGGGSDVIYGDAGNDSIIAESVFDGDNVDDSPDVIYGGTGEDDISVRFFSGGGAVYGGDDADVITVDLNALGMAGAILSADAGADLVVGGYGNDTIIAGQGRDTLYGSLGDDRLLGLDTSTGTSETGAEIDDIMRLFGLLDGTITFEEVFGTDPFLFSNAAQELFGGDGNDTLAGGRSGDLMWGGFGDDGIWGAGGNDTIEGNEGNDIVEGGFGNDVIYGGVGFDFMLGGRGSDTLYGGDDADYFVFTEVTESRGGAGNRDVIADFNVEIDLIDFSALSQAGVNFGLAYDTGEGIGFLAVGDFDFTREVVDVVIFTEVVAGGVLIRAQHFDVFTAGAPDPGTADTDFEILVEGVTALAPFNFDTGFNLA